MTALRLDEIWQRHLPDVYDRVCRIEQAAAALRAGQLSDELRIQARRSAQTLAGSAGTFGFSDASHTARMIQFELADGRACQPAALDALVRRLREGLALEGPHHGKESHV